MADYILSAFADEVTPVFEDQLAYLKGRGVGFIEPRNVDGVNVSSLTADQAKDAKAKLDAYGIRVSSIGSPIGKIGIDEDFDAHIKLFENTVEVAKRFETKNIRMFSFFYPAGTDVHDHLDAVTARLETLLDIADKNGLVLCHENEARIFGEDPKDCLTLMEHFGGRLKSVLDMGNFAFCKKDPWEGYELLHPYIEYIHIKDAFPDGTIVPAGKGKGRIEDILRAYNAYTDKAVFLTMEPHLTVFAGLNKLSNMDDIKVQNAFETPEKAFDAALAAMREILSRI